MESLSHNSSVNIAHRILEQHLLYTDRINMCSQTYFIKANSNSVSDWYFRVMTKAEECRIEFHVEVFRINKNNHGLVEVEGDEWEGEKNMHQYLI